MATGELINTEKLSETSIINIHRFETTIQPTISCSVLCKLNVANKVGYFFGYEFDPKILRP